MTNTPNLGLPLIDANQNQKHVTHNSALAILDALVQIQVQSAALTTPPGTLIDGQCWIVASGGTGAWVGKDLQIAAWQSGAWTFLAPRAGYLAYNIATSTTLVWTGSAWVSILAALSTLSVTALGVATAADAGNPLSVTANNALFNALATGSGGTGDLRVKLNKAAAANTASFLFQDGFSGRAEIGLVGDDNFHFKVSANGSAFSEGLLIDRGTGAVVLGNARTPIADANYTALATDRVVAYTSLTAARTVTLPDPTLFPAGTPLLIEDASGTCSTTNTLTINLSTGTLYAVLNAANAYIRLMTNGSAWKTYGRTPNIVTFSSSGTYTPSPGLSFADVYLYGGGGGGGGGCQQASGTGCSGGGGGGGGALVFARLNTASIGSGGAVTVGAGGSGGAAASGSTTAGGSGSAGGRTTFIGTGILAAGGGGFGAGGQLNAASGGGASTGTISFGGNASGSTAGAAALGGSNGGSGATGANSAWATGGAGGAGTTSAGVAAAGGTAAGGGAGGGSGGGLTTAPAANAGGAGGPQRGATSSVNGGTAGTSPGGTGGAGGGTASSVASPPLFAGGGGAGGGSATSGTAGAGGAGGVASGGGGGGSVVNGGTAGAGGSGGAGFCLVVEYF